MSRIRLSLVLTIAIGLGPFQAMAQTTSGTLVGVVLDPSSLAVAGAIVSVTNEVNGNRRSTQTITDGSYRIPFMPPGRYTIRASSPGFSDNQITGFPVPLNSTTNLVPPITLGAAGTAAPPAGASTAADTEGDERAPVVNTNDATRRGNFAIEQVHSLPLGGTTETRTFDELALLVPGVAPAPYVPGVRGPGVGFGIGTAGQFAVNGLRARSNNFTVDGSDNNDPDVGVRRQGFVSLVPQSIESVQEFQLSTLLWDAEAGRNVGSQVNAVSRSGGNTFHGTLYGFFTDSRLSARNAFDFTGGASQDENPYTRAQAGFVFGGPIVEDRTQFFASFEHIELHGSIEQHFSTPSLAERRFLGVPRFGVVHSPLFQDALNYVTDEGTSPIGAAVLGNYPLPNNPGGPYGVNTYSEVLPADGRGDILSVKVNHSFNEDNELAVRYNFGDDNRTLPSVNRAIRSTIGVETRTQNLSVIFDSALSATVFNQARFSFGRTNLQFPEFATSPFLFESAVTSNVLFLPSPDGSPGGPLTFTATTTPIGELIVEPYSPVGVDVRTFPQGRVNNVFQMADTVAWTMGHHSLKAGGDVRRLQLNSFQDRNYRPQVVYNNGLRLDIDEDNPAASQISYLTGVQLATIGLPSSIFQTLTAGVPNSTIGLRYWEMAGFVNDSWRVRPNLTLDLGVRYEFNTVPAEVNSRIENAIDLTNLPVAGGSQFDSEAATNAFMLSAGQYDRLLADRTSIYDDDPNNFAPHFGFAWDPQSDGRTSIRGGYGVSFDAILGAVVSQSRNVFPTEVPLNIAPSLLPFLSFFLPLPSQLVFGSDGGPELQFVAPGTVNQFGGAPEDFVAVFGRVFRRSRAAGGLAYTLPAKDLATPYAQQWHLTVEREIAGDIAVSAAYVGTKGSKLTRMLTPNNGPGITPVIPVLFKRNRIPIVIFSEDFNDLPPNRPVTPFLGSYRVFENSASSNYHALQLEARKRMSHGYAFTIAYTWSHAIDDVSDVFPIAGAPVLPADHRNLRLECADAGYDVRHRIAASVIWDLPFWRGVTTGDLDDASFWLGGWQIASIAQGHTGQPFTLNLPIDINLDGNLTDRPATENGLIFFDEHGPERVRIADGVTGSEFLGPGSVGRNSVRGDGYVNVDLSVNKLFRFSDTQRLELRTEMFNVLNRANYGLPVRVLGNPGFGSAVETASPARVIQFALKYSF